MFSRKHPGILGPPVHTPLCAKRRWLGRAGTAQLFTPEQHLSAGGSTLPCALTQQQQQEMYQA